MTVTLIPEERARGRRLARANASRSVAVLMSLLVFGACTAGGGTAPASTRPLVTAAPSTSFASPGAAAADLTIFGAASLGKALEQVKSAYESANPGSTLA